MNQAQDAMIIFFYSLKITLSLSQRSFAIVAAKKKIKRTTRSYRTLR